MTAQAPQPIWTPGPEAADSRIMAFARQAGELAGRELSDYQQLWHWSTTELEQFWSLLWTYFDVRSATPYTQVLSGHEMPGARWFTGATLNYVEYALRGDSASTALVEVNESGAQQSTSLGQLRAEVAGVAAALRTLGVQRGDRVVGYLPNARTAVVALLATASMGAIWASCAQDYGPVAATDRFAQLHPTVLIAADGYVFGGKTADRREATAELVAGLPTLKAVIHVPHLGVGQPLAVGIPSISWDEAVRTPGVLAIENVPFDHPLWVLFTSGTTGTPKGIVHGHGGMILESWKLFGLQFGLSPGDRYYVAANTSWMVWNTVLGNLLAGASVVTYAGSPLHPRLDRQFQIVAENRVTMFATGAAYLRLVQASEFRPAVDWDLSALHTLLSTGSTMPDSTCQWVRDAVGQAVHLSDVSGGTDVCSAFLGSNPLEPVRLGRMQGPLLGVAVRVWNESGSRVTDEVGEMVITRPMPSMPVRFWGDADGSRFRSAFSSSIPVSGRTATGSSRHPTARSRCWAGPTPP